MLRRLGYDLHSLPIGSLTLRDLEFDLCYLIKGQKPVVFDVGANTGQSIDLFRRTLHAPNIISFEPNPALAEHLKQKYADNGVVIERMALGSSEGTDRFNIFERDDLSSMLELHRDKRNPFSNTALKRTISVAITTVDLYVTKYGFEFIDLLKIDTQGFDLEVLRGAVGMLKQRAVGIVLVEVNFTPFYLNQANFGDIERFLAENGYGLLTFYEVFRLNACIGWATACFQPTDE